jgi:hypothetical protein
MVMTHTYKDWVLYQDWLIEYSAVYYGLLLVTRQLNLCSAENFNRARLTVTDRVHRLKEREANSYARV